MSQGDVIRQGDYRLANRYSSTNSVITDSSNASYLVQDVTEHSNYITGNEVDHPGFEDLDEITFDLSADPESRIQGRGGPNRKVGDQSFKKSSKDPTQ